MMRQIQTFNSEKKCFSLETPSISGEVIATEGFFCQLITSVKKGGLEFTSNTSTFFTKYKIKISY